MRIEHCGTTTIHVCPNNCSANFITSAHVMQDWKVDPEGNFVECIDGAVETTHGPDDGNIWTCAECGETADCITVRKYTVVVDVFPMGTLFVEVRDPNCAYWMSEGMTTVTPLQRKHGVFDIPEVGRVANIA